MASNRSYLQSQILWMAMLDSLCLLIGIVAGVTLRLGPESLNEYVFGNLSGWFYLALAIIVSNYVTGAYGLELRLSRFNMVVNWAFSIIMATLVVGMTSYAWFGGVLGRGVFGISLAVYSALWLSLRMIFFRYLFKKEPFAYRVVIIGTGLRARRDLAMVENRNLRPAHKVVAMIQVENPSGGREFVGGQCDGVTIFRCGPANVAAAIKSFGADVVLMAIEHEDELAGVYAQLRRLRFEGVSVLTSLNVAEVYGGKVPLDLVDENWLMQASQGFVSPMALRFKRLMDVTLVLITAPLALVLGLVIALLIKIDSPRSPVFYSQERVGRFGLIFRIYKFRTMVSGAESAGEAVWSPLSDSRVTGIGRFLRRYRLDELPQLLNVLENDMSLVGPRPERPEWVEKLEKDIPFYRERENLLPGLTGWAQIRYPYGATVDDARAKLEYDFYYLQNLSIGLDLRIILHTLRIILFGMEREVW
jgi:exopolysaccharide biosynthesis polyprenyl glycosylphosphotransferase